MHTTKITVTETVEVEHLNISLSHNEVDLLNAILCDWVDDDEAAAEQDGVHPAPHDTHRSFAHKLSYEMCAHMWGAR